FNIYGKKEPYSQVFDAGFLIGLVSLMHFPSLFFILFLWMCFIIYQIFYWREWAISFIGLITPYLISRAVLFLYDKLILDTDNFIRPFVELQPLVFKSTPYVYIIWGLFTLLFLISFRPFIRGLTERTIDVRRKYKIVIMFFLMTLLTVTYSGGGVKLHITLAAIPVSAFMTSYISKTKALFLSEVIITLILIVIFAGKLINL
nr:hypothetical protein [Bacteroidota bacterium]